MRKVSRLKKKTVFSLQNATFEWVLKKQNMYNKN